MVKGAVSIGNIGYTGWLSHDVPREFSYDLWTLVNSFCFPFLIKWYDEEGTFWKVNYVGFFCETSFLDTPHTGHEL